MYNQNEAMLRHCKEAPQWGYQKVIFTLEKFQLVLNSIYKVNAIGIEI